MKPLFSKKQFERFLMVAIGLIALVAADDVFAQADSIAKPNIVLVVTDDESWFERSAYGMTSLPTPNFDEIARRGVLFEHSYVSAPSCAPSRASILTGRNFWELEQGSIIQAWLPSKFVTFVELLAEEGYFVGRTGKGWGPGIYPWHAHGPDVAGRVFQERILEWPGAGLSAIDYAGNFELMLNSRKPDQPFFMWVGIEEPHGPAGDSNFKKLAEEYGVALEDLMIPGNMEDSHEYRISRANYLYEVAYSDTQIGRILDLLDEAGELTNTLFIVTSDNGTTPPSTIYAKATPYEAGVRVPLAIMFPDAVPGGRVVSDFVTSADLAPTLLEAANISAPSSMSGRSYWATLISEESGRVDPSRDFAVTGLEWHGEFDPESLSFRVARDDRFAVIVRYNNVDAEGAALDEVDLTRPARLEFYDLEDDPWQQRNLAGASEYAPEIEGLLARMREYAVMTGDPRFTGDMDAIQSTRQFVIDRKKSGYRANPYSHRE